MLDSRFIVGIDLGTTNIAIFYIDTEKKNIRIKPFLIPQFIGLGEFDHLPLLPSFCYFPIDNEISQKSFKLPWDGDCEILLGKFARDYGIETPNRLISSSKSWLANSGVDRTKPILPWGSNLEDKQKSPLEVTTFFISYIKQAWNATFGNKVDQLGSRCTLEEQQVIITIPASFDETARELTIEAARLANINNLLLVEEPLAAFYAWLSNNKATWQKKIKPKQKILVIDIGGGTTDFSMIETDKNCVFHRYAVGDHLLLGGDNIDMALAKQLENQWKSELTNHDWLMLCQLCRDAKESLLSTEKEHVDITLLKSGGSVLGNLESFVLLKKDLMDLIFNGFFPKIQRNSTLSMKQSGIRKMGLPYTSNPAITEHLLQFLRYAARATNFTNNNEIEKNLSLVCPNYVVFNGGCLIPISIRQHILDILSSWFPDKQPPVELEGCDYSLAVANGAAYHGLVKSGKGINVRGGLTRSYFFEIAEANNINKLICIISRETDENIDVLLPTELELFTNKKVVFNLYSSSVRLNDKLGDVIDNYDEVSMVAPLIAVIQFGNMNETKLKVQLSSKFTEIGTLELNLHSQATNHKWPLKFDLRSIQKSESNKDGRTDQIIIDDNKILEALEYLITLFTSQPSDLKTVVRRLEEQLELKKDNWPLFIVRKIVDTLFDLVTYRKLSTQHESKWLNLMGYCLRPGFGDAEDQLRLRKLWKLWFEGIYHKRDTQSVAEWWIMWRRVASGLKSGHHTAIGNELIKKLCPKDTYRVNIREGQQVKKEMWNCLASLEFLPIKLKIKVGSILMDRLNKMEPYELWLIGRIGGRQLFHVSSNSIIPSKIVTKWIDQLMSESFPNEAQRMCMFACSRLAKITGDRFIDVSPEVRKNVLNYINRNKGPKNWLVQVQSKIEDSLDDVSQVLADPLPLGLSIGS